MYSASYDGAARTINAEVFRGPPCIHNNTEAEIGSSHKNVPIESAITTFNKDYFTLYLPCPLVYFLHHQRRTHLTLFCFQTVHECRRSDGSLLLVKGFQLSAGAANHVLSDSIMFIVQLPCMMLQIIRCYSQSARGLQRFKTHSYYYRRFPK